MSSTTIAAPPSASFLAALAPALTACGLTKVTDSFTANVYATNGGTIQVWRSTGNSYGEDWYLIVGEVTTGGQRVFALSVCEGWDDATKTATRPVPASPNGIAPQADYSAFAAGLAFGNTAANCYWVIATWTDTTGATLTVVGDLNRVVVITPGALSSSLYAGKADRFYATAIDPISPLVCINIGAAVAASSVLYGGCTREPGQTVANNSNWRCQISSTSATPSGNDRVVILGQTASVADSVTGRTTPSPVALHCSRFPSTSTRAILRDLRMVGSGAAAASDTLTESAPDGTTKSYVACSPAGIFVAV